MFADRRKVKGFLNCKTNKQVGTLNTRTIKDEGKRLELVNIFKQLNLSILAISDHKIVHKKEDGQIKYWKLEGCTLITTSAWRNGAGAAVGGVGVLLDRQAEKSLAEVQSINERILTVHFNGNPNTTVISNYSPTEGSDDSEAHYHKLTDVINSLPKHNVIIECGDFNAHLGEKDVPYSYHEQTNSNGNLLLEHATECNLIITNTQRKKKKGKLWTYISDMKKDNKTQIDYILVNKKWKNSIHNVEAYSSFCSLGGDHRLVSATVHLSLRKSKAPTKKIKYDWSVLKDEDIQNKYTVTVKNKYATLCVEDDDASERYEKFIQSNTEAAKLHIPRAKKKKEASISNNPLITAARKNVQDAFKKYQTKPNARNERTWKESKEKIRNTYKELQEEELDGLIKEVENADDRSKHGESWKLIDKITGRKNGKQGIIKGKTKEERITNWYNHFKELLGKEPEKTKQEVTIEQVLQNLSIEDGDFTDEELRKAKNTLRDGKQSGPDIIPPEVVKRCDFDSIILEFANNLLRKGEKPKQWSEIDMIPVPKSGDLSDTSNYRGISLAPIIAKTVNKMMLNRIQPKVDPHLRPNQNGFRPGRTTAAHILALRRLIEGVKSHNKKAIILYVDFKKAFDSIHRPTMIKILQAYDIPPTLINAISRMYENTRAKVISPDGETKFFEIKAGVLQGDTLAPYLFAIVLDYVMRQTFYGREKDLGFQLYRQRSKRVPAVYVTDLDFADDLALLTEEMEQAQKILLRLENEAEKVGLKCNAKKTEVQAFNQDRPVSIQAKNGEILKVVENFKYLGAWTQSSATDISVRKALAWSACHRLRKVWSSSLRRQLKERLFIATVESVLLYGSETWTLTKTMDKQINGCYTRMLRMAMNVRGIDHITNEVLYGSLTPIATKIQERRMRLAGHCIRHTEEIANKIILWEPLEGTRNRGAQSTTYIDSLLNDAGVDNTSELRSLMEDRDEWRRVVVSAGRPDGRPR